MTKKYGNLTALAGIDLEIQEGELFGLLGPNGAGKTTLISILATMIPLTTGRATVCGYDVNRQQHAVRRSIGIVFQDPSLDDELTGEENLDFHGRLYGLDSAARRARIEDVLTLVDLHDRRNDLVRTYSGGMRRRLEIARGLMHRPRVLFLDEPTLGLDPQTRRKIWHYIDGLKRSFGMTIILTTHYMDEADRLCARIGIIDRGEIVALDSPDVLKERLGGDLLEIEVNRPDPRFMERLEALEEVISLSAVDNVVSLTVSKAESFIPRCFELAREVSIEISSVALRKPNLEDVFIQLTGRDIREEEAVEPEERIRLYLRGQRR